MTTNDRSGLAFRDSTVPPPFAAGPLASPARDRDREPKRPKESPADAEGASWKNTVVEEATRLLSLLMEFAELERLRNRNQKDGS